MMPFSVGWVRRNAVTRHAMNQAKPPFAHVAPVGYAAARLTHPTHRLIAGTLRLPDAAVALAEAGA